MKRYRDVLIITMLVFLPEKACLANDYHTTPDKWENPRIYHSPYLKNYEKRISIIRASEQVHSGNKLSPNKAYWFAVVEPDTMKEGPWNTEIYIDNEREYQINITLIDHASYPIRIEWINEKLLYIQVWWGRILGSYFIYEVEKEAIITKEMVHAGQIPYQQWQQKK